MNKTIFDENFMNIINILCNGVNTLIKIILKNFFIGLIISALITVPTYYISPELVYFILNKFSIDLSDLKLLKDLKLKNNEIIELKDQLKQLNIEKNKFEVELSKANAESEGLLKGMDTIKIEKTNHKLIIGAICVIVLIGVYFIHTNTSDNSAITSINNGMTKLLEEVMKHDNLTNKIITKAIEDNCRELENRIKLLNITIEVIEDKLNRPK